MLPRSTLVRWHARLALYILPSFLKPYSLSAARLSSYILYCSYNYCFIKMPLQVFDFDAPRRLPQQLGPSGVRAYISNILVTKFDVTTKFAEEAAARWQLGRSHDLYKAPAQRFIDIFGPDVGPAVFSSIHEDIWADWWNSHQGLVGSGTFVSR